MADEKKGKELIEVFDKKTNKNVFISKEKLHTSEGRYSPKKLDSGKMDLDELKLKNPSDGIKKKKDINRYEDYMDFKSGKKDEGYKVMEAAKGGMIKGYEHGGSVKAGRLAKRGYGAAKK
tara:strand:+ start:323 stop:682 length:360 start_codon:yes stop_codon:yes gene_type:complete